MDKRLLIKTLELLKRAYPTDFAVSNLTKKLGVSYDGEFSKIIRYLRATHKVIAPEKLQYDSRITIVPDGIDFLSELRLIETNEKRNEIIKWVTVVIAFTAVINLIVALFLR